MTSIERGSKAEQTSTEEISQRILEGADDSSETSTPMAKNPTDETNAWLRNRNLDRYRASLDDFACALADNLQSIDDLIKATTEAQGTRYTTRILSSYANDEQAKAADLRERIQRLRMRGWARSRFDSTRYEKLCEAALAEL